MPRICGRGKSCNNVCDELTTFQETRNENGSAENQENTACLTIIYEDIEHAKNVCEQGQANCFQLQGNMKDTANVKLLQNTCNLCVFLKTKYSRKK